MVWFNTWFNEFLFSFFLIVFTFLFKNNFFPIIIGLFLTYSINLQNNLIRGIRQISRLENSMISFERCLTYTKIQSEKPKFKKKTKFDKMVKFNLSIIQLNIDQIQK